MGKRLLRDRAGDIRPEEKRSVTTFLNVFTISPKVRGNQIERGRFCELPLLSSSSQRRLMTSNDHHVTRIAGFF
jgi:hypothetical protein